MDRPTRDVHPRAVLLARVFLVCAGVTALTLGLLMTAGTLPTPAWWAPIAAVAAGAGLLLTAVFDSPSGAVGTFLIFFFPWH